MTILASYYCDRKESQVLNRQTADHNSHGRHIWRAPAHCTPVARATLPNMLEQAEKDDVILTFAVPLPEKSVETVHSPAFFSHAVEQLIETVAEQTDMAAARARQERQKIKARYAASVTDSAYLHDHQIPSTKEDQKASVLQDTLQDLKRISRYSDRIAPLPNALQLLESVETGLKLGTNAVKRLNLQDLLDTGKRKAVSV